MLGEVPPLDSSESAIGDKHSGLLGGVSILTAGLCPDSGSGVGIVMLSLPPGGLPGNFTELRSNDESEQDKELRLNTVSSRGQRLSVVCIASGYSESKKGLGNASSRLTGAA